MIDAASAVEEQFPPSAVATGPVISLFGSGCLHGARVLQRYVNANALALKQREEPLPSSARSSPFLNQHLYSSLPPYLGPLRSQFEAL